MNRTAFVLIALGLMACNTPKAAENNEPIEQNETSSREQEDSTEQDRQKDDAGAARIERANQIIAGSPPLEPLLQPRGSDEFAPEVGTIRSKVKFTIVDHTETCDKSSANRALSVARKKIEECHNKDLGTFEREAVGYIVFFMPLEDNGAAFETRMLATQFSGDVTRCVQNELKRVRFEESRSWEGCELYVRVALNISKVTDGDGS